MLTTWNLKKKSQIAIITVVISICDIILLFAVLVSQLAATATVIENLIYGYGKFAVMVYFPIQLI